MATRATIELNGKVYETSPKRGIGLKSNQAARPHQDVVRFIDGVRRPDTPVATPVVNEPAHKPVQVATRPLPKHSVAKVQHAGKVHNRTQKAAVLHRGVVPAPKAATVTHKPTAPAHDSRVRQNRAAKVDRSTRITRFAALAKPVKRSQPQPHPLQPVHHPAATSAATHTHAKTPASKKEEILSQAVKEAPVHRTRKHKAKKHRHVGVYFAAAAVALLAVGYMVYLNIPSLSMKLAASRAGFSAHLPSYQPDGYNLAGPIAYSEGRISVGYQSTTDSRKFNIVQQQSNWDSESLLTNVVNQKENYQTYRDRGLTIYVYGDNNATWVNGGVWYSLEGDSGLSSQQIAKIAASM